MQSATILADENIKLRASNKRQRRKRKQSRQCIARGGALQAQEGRALVAEAERRDQSEPARARTRAPPTRSKCHVQGHNRTQSRTIQSILMLNLVEFDYVDVEISYEEPRAFWWGGPHAALGHLLIRHVT
jgi:hypothetical protein